MLITCKDVSSSSSTNEVCFKSVLFVDGKIPNVFDPQAQAFCFSKTRAGEREKKFEKKLFVKRATQKMSVGGSCE